MALCKFAKQPSQIHQAPYHPGATLGLEKREREPATQAKIFTFLESDSGNFLDTLKFEKYNSFFFLFLLYMDSFAFVSLGISKLFQSIVIVQLILRSDFSAFELN